MRNVAIACVQFAPHLDEKNYNLTQMEYWIEKVMTEHPDTDLILFPELATSGYDGTLAQFRKMADEAGKGETARRLGKMAAQYHVYLVFGYPEAAGDALYNSMELFDREGKMLCNYRKVHPFATENRWCKKGNELKTVETDFGRVGMMICYDTVFPEAARTLALQGADILLISTNWEKPYTYDWDLVTAARAYDNVIPLAAANRVGKDVTTEFFGHSMILDPLGRPLEKLFEETDGYIWHRVDLEETAQYRSHYYTTFQDRRSDVYQIE